MNIEAFKEIASILPNKVIPLKGIELIQSLYPNIALRSMCDIDLLTEQDYAEKNWRMLHEQGWQYLPVHEVKKSKLHGSLQETTGHHLPLYRDGIRVELHWSLFQNNKFQNVTRKAAANSVKVSGNRHRLTHEMMLVHLCRHFCKHLKHGVILRQSCDINELLRKHEAALDWNEIEQICSEPELRNDVAMALSYAHILLDAPVPQQFLAEKMLKRKHAVLSSFLAGERSRIVFLGQLRNYFFILKKMPGLVDKSFFIFRTFVPQKEWMAGKYDVSTAGNLAMAYPRYWLKLVNVYLIGER